MRADLIHLLELQAKDRTLSEADAKLAALGEEATQLDQTLERARESLEAARHALTEGRRRRDELEAKIEGYRTLQERRQQRLEQVRNPKEASAVMTELDLARSVMAKEESEWVRSADAVVQLELKVQGEELNLRAVEASQAPERSRMEDRRTVLQAERDAARDQREATAALVDKPLRTRYDRLRRTRTTEVVVPLSGRSLWGMSYDHAAEPTQPNQVGGSNRWLRGLRGDSVPLGVRRIHMTAPAPNTLPKVSLFPPPVLRWRVVPSPDPLQVQALAAVLNLPQALAALLVQRGHGSEERLPGASCVPLSAELSDPNALAGMAEAVQAITAHRSAPAAHHGARRLRRGRSMRLGPPHPGAASAGANVVPFLPHRLRDGYDFGPAGLRGGTSRGGCH